MVPKFAKKKVVSKSRDYPETTRPSRVSKIDVLRKKLEIDREALDECLCQQPSIFFEVADLCAQLLNERDHVREEQKTIRGRIVSRLFADLKKSGDKPPTVAQQDAYVEEDEEWQESRREYKDKEAELARAEGLKESFRQRGFALQSLAKLASESHYQNDSVYDEAKKRLHSKRQRG